MGWGLGGWGVVGKVGGFRSALGLLIPAPKLLTNPQNDQPGNGGLKGSHLNIRLNMFALMDPGKGIQLRRKTWKLSCIQPASYPNKKETSEGMFLLVDCHR